VLDVVARQDRDRPLGRQLAPQERGGDARHRIAHLRISHAPPIAVRIAMRKKDAVGRFLRPTRQRIRDARVVSRQRCFRADQDGAVGAAFELGLRHPEPHPT